MGQARRDKACMLARLILPTLGLWRRFAGKCTRTRWGCRGARSGGGWLQILPSSGLRRGLVGRGRDCCGPRGGAGRGRVRRLLIFLQDSHTPASSAAASTEAGPLR
mmetsp:Transcript_32889/g.102582  ORF Transcript_32889/g.102582 Transcript_32889/m.102582 type:complete len:106 (+) Transcript_32889:1417-1734(+)